MTKVEVKAEKGTDMETDELAMFYEGLEYPKNDLREGFRRKQ